MTILYLTHKYNSRFNTWLHANVVMLSQLTLKVRILNKKWTQCQFCCLFGWIITAWDCDCYKHRLVYSIFCPSRTQYKKFTSSFISSLRLSGWHFFPFSLYFLLDSVDLAHRVKNIQFENSAFDNFTCVNLMLVSIRNYLVCSFMKSPKRKTVCKIVAWKHSHGKCKAHQT